MYIDYYIDDYTNDILCEFDTTKLLDIFENEKDLTNVYLVRCRKEGSHYEEIIGAFLTWNMRNLSFI